MLTRVRVNPLGVGAILVVVVLVVAQWYAGTRELTGPLTAFAHDLTGHPLAGEIPWGALVLGLIAASWPERFVAVGFAAAIDLGFTIEKLVAGADQPITMGAGPTWVLPALAVYALTKLEPARRERVVRMLAYATLLLLSGKVSQFYLPLTVDVAPDVLDQYVAQADTALHNPSWVVGSWIDALGPAVQTVLHVVYAELPTAAIVIGVWQLRGVAKGDPAPEAWPRHNLVRTFVAIGLIGPTFYLLFPVVGPAYAFGSLGGADAWTSWWPHTPPNIGTAVSEYYGGGAYRNCMPSLHTAWATAIFLHSRSGPRWVRVLGSIWLPATLTATLGFGYHYGIDLLAGAILALLVDAALRDPERGFYRQRLWFVGAAAVTFAALVSAVRWASGPIEHYGSFAGPLMLAATAAVAFGYWALFFSPANTALGRFAGRTPASAPEPVKVPAVG